MSTHRELVLVGAGHAHVQVLRRWMMRPVAGVRLTLVVDRPEAVYSGMVPGFVAGDYAPGELEIDAVPLARRAGAAVVLAAATRVDPGDRRVHLAGRPPLSYDVASLDVGSTVRGLDEPGVREHALSTRPIGDFVAQLEDRLERLRAARPARLVVVGGGAAGVEIAFTLQARLGAEGVETRVEVLSDAERLLPGYPARVAARALREARRRGIRIRTGARVTAVERDAVVLDRTRVPCDLAVWATGAAPVPQPDASELPRDPRGFVRVAATLQVVGRDDLFAVGDCAVLDEAPWVPRAGVYAVRQGPVLDFNLRARLEGRPLRRYAPQRDFLSLLHLGGERALAAKWGAVGSGRWVWRWKDRIDRRFVRRFQVLAPEGREAPRFPSRASMGMEEMPCGGCAAKLDGATLAAALGRLGPLPPDASVRLGLERPDDAAAFELPGGDVLLATLDAFRAFSDDPWLVGRVAAVNAVSDVLAKGGAPRYALALVGVPAEGAAGGEELLYQVLAGMRAGLDPLGVSLVGGHTTSGPELFVGLSITGALAGGDDPLPLAGLRAGDALLLTKPLGTGVLLAADMQGRARGAWVRGLHESLLRPNLAAARVAREFGASACTDVSGFGLAGHLLEMLRASGVAARISPEALPALDGALPLLALGLRSTFHAQNAGHRDALRPRGERARDPLVELAFDPQTSGGLLFGVAAERVAPALAALHKAGDAGAACIGAATAFEGGARLELE